MEYMSFARRFTTNLSVLQNRNLEAVERDVSEVNSLAELDALEARALRLTDVPRIHRDRASYERDVTEDGNRVRLRIPYSGNGVMFQYHARQNSWAVTGVEAALDPEPGRWVVGRQQKSKENFLVLENTFTGASSDEVRNYFRPLVDDIDTNLSELRTAAAEVDRLVAVARVDHIAQRRKVLQADNGLDDLGTGI